MHKLIELMVYNDKLSLEELILIDISLKSVEESKELLKSKADKWTKPLSLTKVHIGGFSGDIIDVDTTLIEILVIHPMS